MSTKTRSQSSSAAPPPLNVRSAWPAREAAVVETFTHCGVRVSELVGLTVATIERDRQQVLLKVRAGAKGGKPRNVPIPQLRVRHPSPTCRFGMPDQPSSAQQIIGDFAPKLVELTDEVLFGGVWERPGLAKPDRSLITAAALNRTEQLPGHLRCAIDHGVTLST
jgi:integrase